MKIKKITLLSLDINEQFDFYKNTLELPCAFVKDELHVSIGASQLIFQNDPRGKMNVYHFAMNIPQNKFKEAVEWLEERCVLIVDKNDEDTFDFKNWNAHSVYAYDPSGNIIELIARHDLKNEINEKFSSGNILNISEIGIASKDVIAVAQSFEDKYGLKVYKGTSGENFTPMGDETGLFIFVKEGREWFPDTGVLAEILPIQIEFEADNGQSFLFSLQATKS